MDSGGIEKRTTGKFATSPIFRACHINEPPRLVPSLALFGPDGRPIYDEFLDASNHQVPIEWILQYYRRTAGHDPEPGGRSCDGSHFTQFRSKTGAEIPRGVASTRRSLGSRANGHNSFAFVCGGALVLRGDWSLRLSGSILGHAERVSF